jgi:uncharacterized protein DUF4157
MNKSREHKSDSAATPASPRVLQRSCECGQHTGGGTCETCRQKQETKTLQRSAIDDNPAGNAVPPIVHEVLRSPGKLLDDSSRSFFEPRLGRDFSRVRVHSDRRAADSAAAVNARAYTVGDDVVFGEDQFQPHTAKGQSTLAHELVHTAQQGTNGSTTVSKIGEPDDAYEAQSEGVAKRVLEPGVEPAQTKSDLQTYSNGRGKATTLQRVPEAPSDGTDKAPFERSKVDIPAVPDMVAQSGASGLEITPYSVTAKFNDPNITHLAWELYDPSDNMLDGFGTVTGAATSTTAPFVIQNNDPGRMKWTVVQGRYIIRCVGYSNANKPVAYADRSFYIWTTKPTGKPPDIAALEAQKKTLEATTAAGSGKSFGEVGSAFSKLKDVTHDLAVLQTGTGTYVGNKCSVKPGGTTPTDCTNIVLEVLENTFTQQGKAADWAKVKTKWAANTTARGGTTGMSGLDVQAALQSEAGWKGIFWAPDPAYQVPKAELDKANPDEASYTLGIAKSKGTYYKDYGKKGYPGVSVSQIVTNYAPEAPKAGTASTTTKDMTQLNKLKKLPFGVMSAHGGEHMMVITYGKVIEVHWRKEATSADVIEQMDLESWAVGPKSGYHYYASGVIVAPAADVDAAFK